MKDWILFAALAGTLAFIVTLDGPGESPEKILICSIAGLSTTGCYIETSPPFRDNLRIR